MDPDTTFAKILHLTQEILEDIDRGEEPCADDALELAEAVQALNVWIVGGGFLPAVWGVTVSKAARAQRHADRAEVEARSARAKAAWALRSERSK